MQSIELYAFVGSIGSVLLYVGYVMWAFIPDSILNHLGIHFYPDKGWALALPSFLVITFVFTYIFNIAFNMMTAKPFNTLYSIQDEHSKRMIDCKPPAEDGLPEIYDIPVDVINNLLYYPGIPPKNPRRNNLGDDLDDLISQRTNSSVL